MRLGDEAQQFELVVSAEVGDLGFLPSGWPPDDVFVAEITPASWADQQGLQIGDAWVSLDGQAISKQTKKILKEAMRRRPLRLAFARNAFETKIEEEEEESLGLSFDAVASRGVESLGFWPWGFPPDAVLVYDCDPQSWAAEQGVRAGDELVVVNGTKVRRMTGKQLRKAMRGRPLNMTFVRKEGALEEAAAIRIQKMQRGRSARQDATTMRAANEGESRAQGKQDNTEQFDVLAETHVKVLGFRPWGVPPEPVLIYECTIGSWASQQKLRIGDEVVLLNDQDVGRMAMQQLRNAMKARPLKITLVRREGALEDAAALRIQTAHRASIARKQVSTTRNDDLFADLALDEQTIPGVSAQLQPSQAFPIQSVDQYHSIKGQSAKGSDDMQQGNSDVQIKIISARGLRKADRFGSADPFCECTIQGRSDVNIQTMVAEKTVNPVWNHSDTITNYVAGTMHFSVWDWDRDASERGDGRELLGRASLRFDQCFPNGFAGALPLVESQRDKATLTVQVIVSNSESMEVVSDLVKNDEIEELVDSFRLVFPSATWPAPPDFAGSLSVDLERLGATRLHVVGLSLAANENRHLVAELSGPSSAIEEIRNLQLQHLEACGHQVDLDIDTEGIQEAEGEFATKSSDYLQELGLLRAEYDTQKRSVEKHLQWLERTSKDSGSVDASSAHKALQDVTILLEDCFATAFQAIAAAQSELTSAQDQARAEVQEELDYERAKADAIMAGFKRGKRRHGFATAAVTTSNLFELLNREALRYLFANWRIWAKLEISNREIKGVQASKVAEEQMKQDIQTKKLQEHINELKSQQASMLQKLNEMEQKLQFAEDKCLVEASARKHAEENAKRLEARLAKSSATSNPNGGANGQQSPGMNDMKGQLRMLTTVVAAQKLESVLSKIHRRRLVAVLFVLRTSGEYGVTLPFEKSGLPSSHKPGNTLERLARARAMMNNAAWEHGLDAFAGKYPLPTRPGNFVPVGPGNPQLLSQIQNLREYVDEVDERAWDTSNTQF